jgi:hypothetical protein
MSRAAPKALAYAFFGARGTGKTAAFVQLVARVKPPRLMVWDFKSDPALQGMGQAFTSMAALLKTTQAPAFTVRYIVDHSKDIQEQFDVFCRIAWAAGNLMMAVDELPEVTKASRAPPIWRKCVNVGREYVDGGKKKSLTIVGLGQRPGECDKSFISNCDVYHVGRLTYKSDAMAMADPMGCDYRELMKLPDLHYIEKEASKPDFSRGLLSFSNSAPRKKTAP